MSEENVEVVRHIYEAMARDDVPAVLDVLDPDIEIQDHDLPDATEYQGLEGVLAWQADWDSSWENWRWEAEEFIDLGDRVIAVLRTHAKGRGSGVELERLDGAICSVSRGKVSRIDYYGSKAEALEAAGLSE